MKRLTWALCLILVPVVALPGCGRLRRPGFHGKRSPTGLQHAPRDPQRPDKPFLQWGPETAKVRLVGFFYISKDPKYQRLIRALEGLANKHQGKLYIKYWDLRTKEGATARSKTGAAAAGVGLLINGRSEITIEGDPPYKVDFNQDMGRFWTEENLDAAVAQEVARAYPK